MSEDDVDLNGTYTVRQGLPPLIADSRHRESTDHVITMPLTPRDNSETAQSEKPPKHKSERHKKKRKHSRDRSSRHADSVPFVDAESDSLGSPYRVVATSSAVDEQPPRAARSSKLEPILQEHPLISPPMERKVPTIENPPEVPLQTIRRRSVASRKGDDEIREAEISKMFRKKRKKRCEKERDIELIMAERDICNFINSNFHQTPDAEQTDIAGGRKNSLSVSPNQKDWKTTSAFGRINFRKDAKSTYEPPYIRLHKEDSKDALLELMSDHWKLPDPKLIVSIRSVWRIFLFAILPIMVPLLKFVRKKDTDPRMDERQSDPVDLADLTRNDDEDKSPVMLKPLINVKLKAQNEREISYFKAIYRAFRSPIVKCIHYSLVSERLEFSKDAETYLIG
ncbi:hypothetical protein EB796_012492 [Bugula neritina]|uniref:Uncharacterized protein n=1 Tax=Bugula neritina TaxID=10212 RepID=A0A7J7JTI8_BUGNE|nr:hypothetical protein EB796_012492 [Bugula neritina]